VLGHLVALQPPHITAAVMILAYCHMASQIALICGIASVLLAAAGYAMADWMMEQLRAIVQFMRDALPTTALGWGAITVSCAFILLGVGSILSLRRTAPKAAPKPGV